MIDIYICEDLPDHLGRIAEIIINALSFHNLNQRLVLSASDPELLLDQLAKSRQRPGLYFLDINLGAKMNGFQLAMKIREIDPHGYIVFITSHAEMSLLSFEYKTEALDFIPKYLPGTFPARIIECMLTAEKREEDSAGQTAGGLITLKIGGQNIRLDADEIIVIRTTTEPHWLTVVTSAGCKRIYGTIKEWISTLDSEHFIQCSASEIVNIQCIKSFDQKNKILYLTHNEQAYVSTRYAKKIVCLNYLRSE